MTQVVNDVTGNAAPQQAAKPAWTAPVIETYDVAEFTLSVQGSHGFDAGNVNVS